MFFKINIDILVAISETSGALITHILIKNHETFLYILWMQNLLLYCETLNKNRNINNHLSKYLAGKVYLGFSLNKLLHIIKLIWNIANLINSYTSFLNNTKVIWKKQCQNITLFFTDTLFTNGLNLHRNDIWSYNRKNDLK